MNVRSSLITVACMYGKGAKGINKDTPSLDGQQELIHSVVNLSDESIFSEKCSVVYCCTFI